MFSIISELVSSFMVKQHMWYKDHQVSKEHNRYHSCWLKFMKNTLDPGKCVVHPIPLINH